METLQPGQIAQFMKRFAFRGGRLLAVSLKNGKPSRGALLLRARTHVGEKVRLKMVFEDLIEFRFQRRPIGTSRAFEEVRLGYFEGAFYLNMDAFADVPVPQLMDFRNSEAFIAGTKLSWEIVAYK